MKKPAKIEAMNAAIEARDNEQDAVRLQQHVERISKNFALMGDHLFEVGKELKAIQDEKDFTGTFESFVKTVWGKTRDWAYKLIEAYETRLALPEADRDVIKNPQQALALAAAPEDRRSEVVREVSKSPGKVTSKKISEAVKSQAVDAEVTELDEIGFEIPKKILGEWNRAKTEASDAATKIKSVRSWFKTGTNEASRDPIFHAVIRNNHKPLSDILAQIDLVTPYAVCTTCDGENRKCKHCKGTGFLSKYQYERVDVKTRAAREKKGATLKTKARK